jgi:hypothetical protein
MTKLSVNRSRENFANKNFSWNNFSHCMKPQGSAENFVSTLLPCTEVVCGDVSRCFQDGRIKKEV